MFTMTVPPSNNFDPRKTRTEVRIADAPEGPEHRQLLLGLRFPAGDARVADGYFAGATLDEDARRALAAELAGIPLEDLPYPVVEQQEDRTTAWTAPDHSPWFYDEEFDGWRSATVGGVYGWESVSALPGLRRVGVSS